MKVAKSLEELEKQILKDMEKAMNEASKQMKKDMQKGTEYFYSKGPGSMYVRTGQLGKTPNVTPVTVSGNEVSFDAYLDKDYVYNSGDKPDMGQVLELANYGNPWRTQSGAWANPTVGNNGFWEKSEEYMEDTFDKVMGKYFK